MLCPAHTFVLKARHLLRSCAGSAPSSALRTEAKGRAGACRCTGIRTQVLRPMLAYLDEREKIVKKCYEDGACACARAIVCA